MNQESKETSRKAGIGENVFLAQFTGIRTVPCIKQKHRTLHQYFLSRLFNDRTQRSSTTEQTTYQINSPGLQVAAYEMRLVGTSTE